MSEPPQPPGFPPPPQRPPPPQGPEPLQAPEFPEPPELPPGLRPRGLRKQPKVTSPPLRGAVAGSLLLGAVLACAGVGLGIGALLGAPVPLALVGLFAGFGVGFALVRVRFRDL